MNKYLAFQLLILLFLLNYFNSYSQNETKTFNGIINYALSYEGDAQQSVLEQQPKEFNIKFKSNKIRTNIDQGGNSISIIKNSDTKTIITLMDLSIMNIKVFIKTTRDEINTKLSRLPDYKIKILDETKNIAGYKCKKGELITTVDSRQSTVDYFYFTDELGKADYNFDSPYREIKGILMEFVKKENKIKVVATATNVSSKSISDTEFMIPKGYEEMTIEQLTKLFNK